jgi:hypothetical protein
MGKIFSKVPLSRRVVSLLLLFAANSSIKVFTRHDGYAILLNGGRQGL